MAGFLSIPLKKSYDLDVAGPVRTFIACTYSSSEMPTDYESINEFNKLRSKACVQLLDKHESSLELLYRYYDQLVAIEGKLPLTPTQIPIPFKWKECFERGGLFGSKSSLASSYGTYEKACVMFNIAALQSQIAANQKMDTDDELKLAAKLFMQSSGVLNTLKDGVLSMVQSEPTSDLMPDTLSALSALMLAQAQEAIYLKAAKDDMKPALIAKIAAQAAEFYYDAAKQMGREGLRSMWDKDWLPYVNGKHQAFLALSQYHQSLVAKESKEIGEELARLTSANQSMQVAQQQFANARNPQIMKSEVTVVQKAYESAKKDNDFIYHERIPDLKQLPTVQKAALAKCQPMNSPLSRGFKDLFEKLTPIGVQQALARYDARKGTIVQGEVARLREHTNLMNTILASLNLPAALEDATSRETLPESIREKSTKIKGMGGVSGLERTMNELPNLLKRNQEIIEETRRLLRDEKASDDELRNQFKERWTRMPSEKLTDVLYQELARYTQFLETAMNADKIVRDKFNANRHGFELLSKTEVELKAAIPGLGTGDGGTGSPAVQKLKNLMEEVNEIKNEREKLENELKNKTFDMTSTFLRALAETNSSALNDEQLSLEKLNEIYGPLRNSVTESIRRQERVMEEVQAANDQFAHEKGAGSGLERENVLKMLVTSHDSYLELYANLEEGAKFYNDLTPIIVRFQSKVNDYCFARKTEKEDLMKDLQRNIVSQPPTAMPSQPAYHGGQTQGNQPPGRPPPPKFQTAPGGQAPVQSIQPTFGQQPYVPYASATLPAVSPSYSQPPQQNPYPYSLAYSSYPSQPHLGQQQQQQPQYSATAPYPTGTMPGYPPYPAQQPPYGMPQPQGYPAQNPQQPQQWHQ